MNIPFHKPHITQDEIDSVIKAMKSGWLTMGPKTMEFEKQFKNYIGASFSISMSSATAALHLALNAIGLGKNDEVIIPTNTFVATAESILYSEGKPILCDINKENHNLDVNLIENLITSKTKAIIPVHYGGNPCDMDSILEIGKKYNIKIIEDAAHAVPATYKGKKIGTIGDITCFSFYATKTLTTGEGGMATTENEDFAKKISLQRLHGIRGDTWKRYDSDSSWYYEVQELGYKYNMTDIQASIGLAQLQKLEKMKEKRKAIYKLYSQAFNNKVNFIKQSSECESAYHLFVIKAANRDYLFSQLKKNGIGASVHFIPIHEQPYYKNKFGYKKASYPVANQVYKESLSIPIYPDLNRKEIEYIIENVLKYTESSI